MKYFQEKIKAAVERVGTPLQIAFSEVLIDNITKAKSVLSQYCWQENIFYSYKTNPVPETPILFTV
ncbi:MAG: hypothetical protein KKG02_05540 [Candidatus Edwardsbacteria bacterium]|nr:hypothetical protein [Candidatus Edwardsbacteria bacterium]MBU2593994.1 hypothetical protein [Candidatus Edwardsbacteria bacterium]